jgi:hypothetical protein
MTKINKRKTLLAAALLSISLATPAFAVTPAGSKTSGTADVTANLPEFIILHYYSGITLNFATPSAEALDEDADSRNISWKGESSGGEGLASENLTKAALELDGTKTTVRLPNVWAVRGFSSDGTATVSVEIPTGKNTMSNGDSKIVMSNLQVSDNSDTGVSISTKLNGITKNAATTGNIEMDLDFSLTTLSGEHSGAQYMITASTY